MRPSFWRVLLAGALGVIALFILPFVFIRLVLFFLLIGLIFRILWGGRWRRARYHHHRGERSWYQTKQPLDQSKEYI